MGGVVAWLRFGVCPLFSTGLWVHCLEHRHEFHAKKQNKKQRKMVTFLTMFCILSPGRRSLRWHFGRDVHPQRDDPPCYELRRESGGTHVPSPHGHQHQQPVEEACHSWPQIPAAGWSLSYLSCTFAKRDNKSSCDFFYYENECSRIWSFRI